MRAAVVPRTILSSISTTRLPSTVERITLSLILHGADALHLPGLDKRAPDIFVLNKPDPVGDARLPCIPDGGVEARIRHADHDIRLHGMLQRQKRAGTQAAPGAPTRLR